MSVPGLLNAAATAALTGVLVYLGVALGLILSQGRRPAPAGRTLSFDPVTQPATAASPADAPAVSLTSYRARDGAALGLRHVPARAPGAPLVVIVHGSGWHGGAYVPIADHLSRHGNFEILLPDLRGHGVAPRRRGDIAYIGQFEDDLADLIGHYRKPGQPLCMIGHSSGGGLVIRFAGGRYGAMLDKAVLLAPFLKYDAPTMRRNAGGWARPLTRRIIGLSMLNALGITALNGLTVMQFAFPDTVLNGPEGATATPNYSYRLNASFAPRRDYLADVAKLPPFLVLAGDEDEAFDACKFEPVLSKATPRGTYAVLPGVAHLGIIRSPDALARTREFLAS